MSERPITIVLVEDDEILSNLLRVKLESRGYKVRVVADGDAGLVSIHENRPDILLLDMLLPFKTGLDILEAIRREVELRDLPVIIVSNSGQPVDIERAKKLGVRDWLVKAEIEPDDILEKVERVAGEIRDTSRTSAAAPIRAEETHTRKPISSAPIVLLIEDDPLISDMLRQKLAIKRYAVLSAVTEPEIYTLLENNPVDLILLDILLPDLNGLELLKKFKEDRRYRDTPVLIISNLGQKEDIERGMLGGAAGYIVKANTYPDEIVEKVETLLKRKL